MTDRNDIDHIRRRLADRDRQAANDRARNRNLVRAWSALVSIALIGLTADAIYLLLA